VTPPSPEPGRPRRDPLRKLLGRDVAAREELLKQDTVEGPKEREVKKGPVGLLRILGPGLITGASDDDPTNIGVYSQVGSQFGVGLLWVFLLTVPIMSAIQELSARIALHTGIGLGKVLRRKFPGAIVFTAISALLIGNVITIGADLRATAAGFALLTHDRVRPLWFVIPVAGLLLAIQIFLTYDRFERVLKWLTLVLLAYVVEAVILHPDIVRILGATIVPHLQLSDAYITAVVAVLGTTLSPYIYFWEASAIVEQKREQGGTQERKRKGVSRADLNMERLDVFVGMLVAQAVMYFLMLSTAIALHDHGKTHVNTALDAAQALAPVAGQFAFVLFAVALIGTGLIAIPVLSASSAYVVGEFFDIPGTLGTRLRYRPTFYAVIILAMIIGTLMDLTPIDPIKALFIASVIEGVIAGPLIVLMVLVGSDRKIMRDKTSGWLSKSLGWLTAALMIGCALYVIANAVQGKTG
jgi:NRAMP (natural resistance-associated macrophage protein)-like metal ion transporter